MQKTDGTYTADTEETIKYMIDHFTPEDNPDSATVKQQDMRKKQEPIYTADDMDFTQDEILQ